MWELYRRKNTGAESSASQLLLADNVDIRTSLCEKYDKCKRFAPVIHQPVNDLQPILNPIPFAQWRMDIIGPFTPASGGRKFLIVKIDFFTKWIETEPTITTNQVKKVYFT